MALPPPGTKLRGDYPKKMRVTAPSVAMLRKVLSEVGLIDADDDDVLREKLERHKTCYGVVTFLKNGGKSYAIQFHAFQDADAVEDARRLLDQEKNLIGSEATDSTPHSSFGSH